MQLQAEWCFPPHLSPSPNSKEKRKPRKLVFVLFTKAWGFESRVQHGVQGMGTAGREGLGPRSPFRTFCSLLNISLFHSVFYSFSKTLAVTRSWSGLQGVTRAHAQLVSPALQVPTLTWGSREAILGIAKLSDF